MHKGIPVLEYDVKGSDKLIFINHGIFGNKDRAMKLIGSPLVKQGYKVVAIDAYKHGERSTAPYKDKVDETLSMLYIFETVKQTTLDIMSLKKDLYDEYKQYDVLGISMGGYVAYYLASQTTEVNTVIPIISAPVFSQPRFFDLPSEYQDDYTKEATRLKNMALAMDPALHPEELSFKKIIAFSGKHDDVIPFSYTDTFIKENPDFDITHELFNTGHQMVPPMQKRLTEHLKRNT